MSLDATRARIDSDTACVVVEAPAGHGKTHEAVRAAASAATSLDGDQRVLFLTHTNAARDTFNRRVGRAAADMRTIHAFAASIVKTYASPLSLPTPLDPLRGQPAFDDMLPLAIDVLQRRPEVARGLALRHPVVLVDEYQDCSVEQHSLIELVASAGQVRRRLFGDGLQGIYEFTEQQVDWDKLVSSHETVGLDTPWRWKSNASMKAFLTEARLALASGNPIDLSHPPDCVSVTRWDGQVPGPAERGSAKECFDAVYQHADANTAVIVHHNKHAIELRRRVRGVGSYHEGADQSPAQAIVESVEDAAGNASELIALLVRVFREWGIGMPKLAADQICSACGAAGVDLGSKRKVRVFCETAESLYETPSPSRWFSVLRQLLKGSHGLDNWQPLRGDQLFLLARMRPENGQPLGPLLNAEARAREARRRAPRGGFMTIHRAKGLEFDRVVIPYCAGSMFADDLPSRRRMYVAMSRAQSHVTFLVPTSDPTPLIAL